MSDYLTMIRGEAKTWEFTIVDASSSAVALSSATFILTVEKEGAATLLSKNSTSSAASFSGSLASGIVTIAIGASSTLSWSVSGSSVPVPTGYYTGQLRTYIDATNIDKYKFNLDLRETL